MKRLTTYKNPSIADQIAAGKGSPEQIVEIWNKLIRDGANRSTLKRVKKAAMVHSIDFVLP